MGWPFNRAGKRKAVVASRAKEYDATWDDKPAADQSIIAGKAVRTKGNPWGDADGGTSQIAENASNAWKRGGY
jgi:hypothetical protein